MLWGDDIGPLLGRYWVSWLRRRRRCRRLLLGFPFWGFGRLCRLLGWLVGLLRRGFLYRRRMIAFRPGDRFEFCSYRNGGGFLALHFTIFHGGLCRLIRRSRWCAHLRCRVGDH